MPHTTTFQYVRIPANEQEAIEALTADKSGGLSHDTLVTAAKQYFFEKANGPARIQQLERASAEERKAIAESARKENPDLAFMADEPLLALVYRSQPACDIMALTVPMAGNGHMAVSLYGADDSSSYPVNNRATALVTACGHAVTSPIRGDVFIGRAHDDEMRDVWERVDFTVEDASPTAEWCRVARNSGGGGGQGGKAASSLNKLVSQQMSDSMEVVNTASPQSSQGMYGQHGVPVSENWGFWTQTDDDVELNFSVPAGTKSKDCKVSFGKESVQVIVGGQTLLTGTTFDPIITDECTTTLQDGNNGRDFCVTLSKKEKRRVWSWAVAQN